MKEISIFEEYYSRKDFFDRFQNGDEDAVTVIIPTVHTNELWEANLKSIYREVPVAKLLIGDGGCVDSTVEIAKKFPRVVIHDHRHFKSLGYSIRKLIESVETDWFIYLHSDVYLPNGWFDGMSRHKHEYDWFGCRMQQTVMIEFDNEYGERPYAGSQMGLKSAFEKGLSRIEDDFVYRQEDFVFSELVASGGFREGKVDEIFHYHQTIEKRSPVWSPRDIKVNITQQLTRDQEVRVWETQFKGIVKYLSPSSNWVIREVGLSASKLIELEVMEAEDLDKWVLEINPVWLPYVKKELKRQRFRKGFKSVSDRLRSLLGL